MNMTTKLAAAGTTLAALLALGYSGTIANACDTCAAHNPPATESAEHGDDHEHLDADEGFVTLLDANHTEGWMFDEEWVKIEDGVIVAGTMDKDIPKTGYAVYEKEYYNFELRLQAKLEGPARGNGGVQIRSTYNPETGAMVGYQADMGHVYWGRLYDQGGKRHLLTEHPEDFNLEEDINLDGWNDYVIRCEGAHVQVWINGKLLADYTEQDEDIAAQPGLIGLQLHFGPPSIRYYRNIRIKELD